MRSTMQDFPLTIGALMRHGTTVHAEGRRTIVRLDPESMRPTPWTPAARDEAPRSAL